MSSTALEPDGGLPTFTRASTAVRGVPPVHQLDSVSIAAQTTDLALEDDALVMAVARGEHPALLALYDRYRGISYGLAYRILGEAGAAEEAVQDAYLRVWRRAATFDTARGAVRPWLLTIVHHCAIDLLRRRGRPAPAVVSFDELLDRHAVSDTWVEVEQRDEQERVRTAVASLPQAQRRAVELAFFEGLTHREIAQREDVPLGTVKGRMRLGLRRLSQLLADPN